MEFLQELFVTAFMAVLLSVIVAASIAFSGGNEKGVSVSVIKIGDEKNLKVVGGGKTKTKTKTKSKKKVKFMDDVVVRDVEDGERFNLDLNFLENFDGILEKSLEEAISRDEVNIDDAEVIISSVVKEIGNVKLADVEEMGCDGFFPVIDDLSEKAVSEVPESNGFEGNFQSQGSGSEMKRNGIDSITELNMVDDDGAIDCTSAVLLGETLKNEAVELLNLSTDKGVEETTISAFDGGLENSRNRALGGMSDEKEDDGAMCEESNGVAMKDDSGELCTVVEGAVRYGGGGDDDDDDWEGIERSELEKVFAKAVNYVEYGGKDKTDELTNMGSNVHIELYGLHKLAIEGPCYEPQPMAFKVYARARWNSWQKLGSMSPELAMEQYIKLLSETDPKWASYHPDAGDGKVGSIPSGAAVGPVTNLTMPMELMANDDEGRRSQDI